MGLLKYTLSINPWGILAFAGGFAFLGILGWIFAGALVGLMGFACSALIITNVLQLDYPYYLKHLEHLEKMRQIEEETRIREAEAIVNKLKGI